MVLEWTCRRAHRADVDEFESAEARADTVLNDQCDGVAVASAERALAATRFGVERADDDRHPNDKDCGSAPTSLRADEAIDSPSERDHAVHSRGQLMTLPSTRIRRSRRLWRVAPIALGAASLASIALAETADEAFERGNALAKQGKIAEAEQAYESAWTKRESWDIAGNLGFMEAEQSKWSEAAGHLDYAVGHMGGLAKPKQREKLEQRFAEAKTHVGWLELVCTPGSSLQLGPKSIGTCPLETTPYLEPGKYAVSATLKGYQDRALTSEIVVGKGAPADLRLEVLATPTAGPSVSAAPSASASGGDSRDTRPVWPIGMGYGMVGVAAGIGVGLVVAANGADADPTCTVDCDAHQATQNDLSNGAFWSFAVATGFAAATTGYLIWAVTGSKATGPTMSVGLLPILSPTLNGLVVEGRF